MDKQTLSNYGWLVIVTLILAVMLALATPFGTYVGDAVVSVANGFVGASDAAIDEDNIAVNEDKWDSKFDYSSFDKNSKVGATFSDGTTLTWDELQLEKNGTKYGYNASAIDDTSIGDNAFYNCDYLISITIPDSVTNVYCAAFDCCDNLTSVTIPNGLTNIDVGTFSSCTSLTSIKLTNDVAIIQSYAFSGCTLLTGITIPNSVTEIGEESFSNCNSLTNITYTGTKAQWSAITFSDYWNASCPEITVTCTDGTITIPANN